MSRAVHPEYLEAIREQRDEARAEVERLTRERNEARLERAAFLDDLQEAATVQNDLRAQRDRLAAALRGLLKELDDESGDIPAWQKSVAAARAALAEVDRAP